MTFIHKLHGIGTESTGYDKTWKKIQDLTVKTVIATQRPIKETDVLNYVIQKGLEEVNAEELKILAKK